MDFTDFVKELLHIDAGFQITRIERDLETEPLIRIYLEYQLPYCEIGGTRYHLYDHAPVRTRLLSLSKYGNIYVGLSIPVLSHAGYLGILIMMVK